MALKYCVILLIVNFYISTLGADPIHKEDNVSVFVSTTKRKSAHFVLNLKKSREFEFISFSIRIHLTDTQKPAPKWSY